jgi:shikimate dehydrogenase
VRHPGNFGCDDARKGWIMTGSGVLPDSRRAAMPVQVGLIGHGIGASRTPRMHTEEGAAHGLDYRYELVDTAGSSETVDTLLDRVEARGFRGVNITHPFKQAVLPFLHELSDAARAVGAVNTVVFEKGRRIGHNTDFWGFSRAFRDTLSDTDHSEVLLLGAGGAGCAVAHALLENGVGTLWIHDVNAGSARALAARLGAGRARVADSAERALEVVKGAVNATPMGMVSHPGTPFDLAALRADHWVADIVYFPLETELLAKARARGCRTMSGAGMAVFQAVRAFELFNGLAPDPTRMTATFDSFTNPAAGR